MLFLIQFPFTDMRRFFAEPPTGLLPYPQWPLAQMSDDFVRSIGTIRKRKGGGLAGWIGEDKVCSADRALRFTKPIRFPHKTAPLVFRIRQRYLYFDGLAVGKFEVGLESRVVERYLSQNQSRNLLSFLVEQPVRIPTPFDTKQSARTTTLVRAGDALTRLYAQSSVFTDSLTKHHTDWTRPGTPQALLLHHEQEVIKLGEPIVALPLQLSGLDQPPNGWLHYSLYLTGNRHIGVWQVQLQARKISNFTEVQILIMGLMRLYTEQSCLLHVLRAIGSGAINVAPKSEQSHYLQDYLNRSIGLIDRNRKQAQKLLEPPELEFVRFLFTAVEPGQKEALLQTLEYLEPRLRSMDIRLNIFKKVVRFSHHIQQSFTHQEIRYMGNQFINYGQTGSMGDNSQGTFHNYQQQWQQIAGGLDLPQLATELGSLRTALRSDAETLEQQKALVVVGEAEAAAQEGNGPKVLEHLSKAGTWVLDIAKDIGTKLAVEAIKQSMGLSG